MEDVTIAIPTYFGNKMVLNCIDSILKTVKDPKIFLIKNDIGWLRACNEAMRLVSGDIILLNDDTFVTSDIVHAMRETAYMSEDIGIVGGMSLMPDGETVLNFGVYVGPDGNTAHLYYGKHSSEFSIVQKRKSIEGSCMYIKRSVINKIGYFDERYGMGYRGEVDYCFRAREAGYLILSTPEAKYIHLTSQTSGPLGLTNDTHKIFMDQWGTKLKLGKI